MTKNYDHQWKKGDPKVKAAIKAKQAMKRRKKRAKPPPQKHHPTSMELIGQRLASARDVAQKARDHYDQVAMVADPILIELGHKPGQFIPASVPTSLLLADRPTEGRWVLALIRARSAWLKADEEFQKAWREYERFGGHVDASTAKPPWED